VDIAPGAYAPGVYVLRKEKMSQTLWEKQASSRVHKPEPETVKPKATKTPAKKAPAKKK